MHMYVGLVILSENKKKKEEGLSPSTNPDERPDLEDYKNRESPTTHTCKDCNKVFSTVEELATHYKKDHPKSF
jgi:hypothetical protein